MNITLVFLLELHDHFNESILVEFDLPFKIQFFDVCILSMYQERFRITDAIKISIPDADWTNTSLDSGNISR